MAMNSFKCSAGLAVIAGLVVAGCGGSGSGSAATGGTIAMKAGFDYKTGIVQADAAAGASATTASVLVDGVVMETLLPKGTSVVKGETVDLLMQTNPIISGLMPATTAPVEMQIDDEDGAIVSTGLYLGSDGIFDLPSAGAVRAKRVHKPLTKKRRKDTTNWFKTTFSAVGEVILNDGENGLNVNGKFLTVKNGIRINSWKQYFTPKGTTTFYFTSGEPTVTGTIAANGGSATGTSVQVVLPSRGDGVNIYNGWSAKLTIKVSQDFAYDQTNMIAGDSVWFNNLTHQDHDDIPGSGINQINLEFDGPRN